MNAQTKTSIIVIVIALLVVFWWQAFVPQAVSTGELPTDIEIQAE